MRFIGNIDTRARHIHTVAILAPAIGLSACVTDRQAAPAVAYPAASFQYQLPVTTAKVSADLVLESCEGDHPLASPTISITPVANPNPNPEQRYTLYGADLSSFWKDRDLTAELYPDGALKSVNGGVADKTGAIVANILKTAAGIVTLFAAPSPPPARVSGKCTSAANQALARVGALKGEIKKLRARLPGSSLKDTQDLQKAVDVLAAEVARLRAGPLHLSLEREVEFRKPLPLGSPLLGSLDPNHARLATAYPLHGMIYWKASELSDWLEVSDGNQDVEFFALAYCLAPSFGAPDVEKAEAGGAGKEAAAAPGGAVNGAGAVAPQCSAAAAEAFATAEAELAKSGVTTFIETPQCYRDTPRPCATTLVMREPVDATMVVVAPAGQFKDTDADEKLATKDLEISQWGQIRELPLTTGLGGNFNVAAGFDEFGRKTSFTWKATSRGEALTGAASSIVDAAGTLKNAFPTQVQRQQAEITQLETQQKLNQLRFCKEVIDAGGFTCPTQ